MARLHGARTRGPYARRALQQGPRHHVLGSAQGRRLAARVPARRAGRRRDESPERRQPRRRDGARSRSTAGRREGPARAPARRRERAVRLARQQLRQLRRPRSVDARRVRLLVTDLHDGGQDRGAGSDCRRRRGLRAPRAHRFQGRARLRQRGSSRGDGDRQEGHAPSRHARRPGRRPCRYRTGRA